MISHFLAVFSQIKIHIQGQVLFIMNKHECKSIPYTFKVIKILHPLLSPNPLFKIPFRQKFSLTPLHSSDIYVKTYSWFPYILKRISFANLATIRSNPNHKAGLNKLQIRNELDVSSNNVYYPSSAGLFLDQKVEKRSSVVSRTLSNALLLLLCRFSRVGLCATPQTAAHQASRPLDSPGKNTGVGCHFLLQCMKVKS